MYGPVLVGERVTLRPHRPEDADVFVEMLADPDVLRYLLLQNPPSAGYEREWIEARATDPNTVSWTIEVGGRCVGNVGLDGISWPRGIGSVGTFIGDKSLWNQGIATEMARIAVDYVFLNLPLRKLVSAWLAPNVASGKLQASIGLLEVGRHYRHHFRDGEWVDEVLTELFRDEWLAARS